MVSVPAPPVEFTATIFVPVHAVGSYAFVYAKVLLIVMSGSPKNNRSMKGVMVLAAKLEGADVKTLRDTLDQLKNKLKSSAIVLAASEGEKVSLIAGVTQDLIARVKAGELVNFVALQVGGKGGGRPDMAQAGGTNPAALPQALASVKDWVEQRL